MPDHGGVGADVAHVDHHRCLEGSTELYVNPALADDLTRQQVGLHFVAEGDHQLASAMR